MKSFLYLAFIFVSTASFSQVDTMEMYFYSSEHRYINNISLESGKQKNTYIYTEGPDKGKELSNSSVIEIERARNNPDLLLCTPCWLKTSNQHGISYEGLFYTDCCVGAYTGYHSNGKISEKGQYSEMLNGELPEYLCMRRGLWRFFDETGNLIGEENYDDYIPEK